MKSRCDGNWIGSFLAIRESGVAQELKGFKCKEAFVGLLVIDGYVVEVPVFLELPALSFDHICKESSFYKYVIALVSSLFVA